MDASKPITFCEHLQLSSVGSSIFFQNRLTLESDRFLCFPERVEGENKVVIVDLSDPNNVIVLRKPIIADSAVMHLKRKILASKDKRQLRIYIIQPNMIMFKSHIMKKDVIFWKWISDSIIGIVTDSSVYHWTIDDDTSPPWKIFDRHRSLSGAQIVNYRMTKDAKWFLLVGIAINANNPGGFKVEGSMQLYNKETGVSRAIEGHAAAFVELTLAGAPSPTKLLTYAVRTATGAKLRVEELDPEASTPTMFQTKTADVCFPAEAIDDFPVSIHVSKRHSIIYLVTKYGFVHLYDLETSARVFMSRISDETISVTADHEATDGIISVNKRGRVFSVNVNDQTIVPYIRSTLNNTELAFNLAGRANLPGADDLYIHRYRWLLQSEKYGAAAKIAAISPRGCLRTEATIEALEAAPSAPGYLPPILRYFILLLAHGKLSKLESVEFARQLLVEDRKQSLENWFKRDKLHCSEELGDIVRLHDTSLALSIYLGAEVHDKVIECLAETDQINKISSYAKHVGHKPDYAGLLRHTMHIYPEKAAKFTRQLFSDESVPLAEVERVMEILMGQNMMQATTPAMLDALRYKPTRQENVTELADRILTEIRSELPLLYL